jgi:hypothetical protein
MKKLLLSIAVMAAAACAAVASTARLVGEKGAVMRAATSAAIGTAFRSLGEKVGAALTAYMASNGMLMTAITLTETQSSNGTRRYQARHLDDAGAPAAAVFYPGFRPRYVRVTNRTDRIQWEWYEGDTSGHALKTVAAGTRTADTASELVVVTAAGSRPSITLAAGVTLQNKQYHIEATG